MPWSSNHTFLATCALGEEEAAAVYKPGRGERHLWDFPEAIYRREVAAYALSLALGWDLVPATVERHDAPLGPGSLQLFIPADFSQHHFTLVEDEDQHDQLRAICAFDVVANNADRKSGHCILGEDGKVWAIDNGLCFHSEPKLRTVIWEFAGEPLPAALVDDLARVGAVPARRLAPPALGARGGRGQSARRRAARGGTVPGPRPRRPPLPLATGLIPARCGVVRGPGCEERAACPFPA